MGTPLFNKKSIVIILIMIVLGVLAYCGRQRFERQYYTTPPTLDSLEKRVLTSGDVGAYYDILLYYPKAGLSYAFIMANKYDYLPACEDIYHLLLITSSVDSLHRLDKKTAQLAIDYLKYAADKEDKDACLLLSREYMRGINTDKDTLAGLRYYYYYCNSDSALYNQLLPSYKEMLYGNKTEDDDFKEERIHLTPLKFKNNPYYWH